MAGRHQKIKRHRHRPRPHAVSVLAILARENGPLNLKMYQRTRRWLEEWKVVRR